MPSPTTPPPEWDPYGLVRGPGEENITCAATAQSPGGPRRCQRTVRNADLKAALAILRRLAFSPLAEAAESADLRAAAGLCLCRQHGAQGGDVHARWRACLSRVDRTSRRGLAAAPRSATPGTNLQQAGGNGVAGRETDGPRSLTFAPAPIKKKEKASSFVFTGQGPKGWDGGP